MSAPEKVGSYENDGLDHHNNPKSRINQIPSKDFSGGQEINMEIINQYGQLMGEFSRLDDELWLSAPGIGNDDVLMQDCTDRPDCNTVLPHESMIDLELLAKCAENSVSLGGMTYVTDDSSSSRELSRDSPVSVLRKRSCNKVTPMATKNARTNNQFANRDARTNSVREAHQLFLSEKPVEPFVLDELTDSSPPTLVRTKKISELLQLHPGERNQNLSPETALNQKPEMEIVKQCIHCHSTKTPQWRDGPMGRKTLCNACGLAYKKVGLFPGYHPLRSSPFNHSDSPNMTEKRTSSTYKVKNVQRRKIFDSSVGVENCGPQSKGVQDMIEEKSDLLDPDFTLAKRNPIYKSTPKKKLPKGLVKKCLHCESVETPQWREGPLGRKTLCNACGVQYKHGRLFPEYRPLKSPTYDPSLHSHLPKKVQQMRMKQINETSTISSQSEEPT